MISLLTAVGVVLIWCVGGLCVAGWVLWTLAVVLDLCGFRSTVDAAHKLAMRFWGAMIIVGGVVLLVMAALWLFT